MKRGIEIYAGISKNFDGKDPLTLEIPLEKIPEAENWKVDNTYELCINAKMVGIVKDTEGGKAFFEIKSIETEDEDKEESNYE